MWTPENRPRYDRSHLRYESDLTDDEWGEIGPLIPPAKRGGNTRTVNVREVVNGVMYTSSAPAASGAPSRRICPQKHGPRLSRTMDLRQDVGADASCAVCEMP